MQTQSVETIADLIDKLGGPSKAADALGATSPQQVVNWRRRGKIPPTFYMRHQEALKRVGIDAPPTFWFPGGGAA